MTINMKLTFAVCAFLLAYALPINAADQAVKPKAAPEELFKKWDANGDGKVTLEEFKAFHREHKPGGPGGTGHAPAKGGEAPPAPPAGQ